MVVSADFFLRAPGRVVRLGASDKHSLAPMKLSLLCGLSGLCRLALAADASIAHPHTGTLEKFRPIDRPPQLSASESAQLDRGKPVHKMVQFRGEGVRHHVATWRWSDYLTI